MLMKNSDAVIVAVGYQTVMPLQRILLYFYYYEIHITYLKKIYTSDIWVFLYGIQYSKEKYRSSSS